RYLAYGMSVCRGGLVDTYFPRNICSCVTVFLRTHPVRSRLRNFSWLGRCSYAGSSSAFQSTAAARRRRHLPFVFLLHRSCGLLGATQSQHALCFFRQDAADHSWPRDPCVS